MCFYLETGYTSLNKTGEELCGDKVESVQKDGLPQLSSLTAWVAGVKANILATLTSKILCCMISNNISIEESIETIIQSLPTCKVRGIAYSTFSVIHVNQSGGEGFLMEFDNPQVIYYHNKRCEDLKRNEYIICDKKVYKSELHMVEDDMAIMMSDGVLHAGVGKY